MLCFLCSWTVPLSAGTSNSSTSRRFRIAAGAWGTVWLQFGWRVGAGIGSGSNGGHVHPGACIRFRHSGNVDPGGTGLANMGVCESSLGLLLLYYSPLTPARLYTQTHTYTFIQRHTYCSYIKFAHSRPHIGHRSSLTLTNSGACFASTVWKQQMHTWMLQPWSMFHWLSNLHTCMTYSPNWPQLSGFVSFACVLACVWDRGPWWVGRVWAVWGQRVQLQPAHEEESPRLWSQCQSPGLSQQWLLCWRLVWRGVWKWKSLLFALWHLQREIP